MAQHQSVDPMTPEQRAEYAVRCRILAAKQRLEGDLASADLNEWIASNYEKPPPHVWGH